MEEIQSDNSKIFRLNKLEKDSKRIVSLRECLRGIPPPPSITNPKINVEDALIRLRGIADWQPVGSPVTPEEQEEWPAALQSSSLDIYYNDSLLCETLDSLYERLRQRCVTHETSSFTGTPAPLLPPESPLTCDLAELFPRSMSSPASPAPDAISLELLAQRRRGRVPRRQSPRKTNLKRAGHTAEFEGLNGNRPVNIASRSMTLSQALSSSRSVTTAQSIHKSKLQQRLIAVDKKKAPEEVAHPIVEREVKLEELSMTHRKKLLWATSQAFKRSYPALSSDANILKRHVSALFRLCQSQWLTQRQTDVDPSRGTSDRMLALATQLAPQVIASLRQ